MSCPRVSWVLGISLALLVGPMAAPVLAQRGIGLVGKGQATPYINGTYRALIIGNDRYDDPEGLWKPLKTAVNDARAVADVLKNDYGFGEVKLLLNATRRQMNKTINQIAEDAQENDSVLIYYAGHGFLRESTKEGYWIPVDAEGRDDGIFYPNAIIKTKLAVVADRAKHVILVSDSCFSGALLRKGNRGISIDQRNERYFRKVAAKKSVQILAAGGVEFVDDNYKDTGHSPFTYYFLEELKTNTSGLLDATELSLAVTRNVAYNATQSPEKGVLNDAGHAGGEFFFVKAAIEAPGQGTQTVAAVAPPPQPAAPPARTIDEEETLWKAVENSTSIEDFQAYLDDYPSGRFARIAKLKIRQLKRKATPRPATTALKQAAIPTDTDSRTWRDPVTGMEFVHVPDGSFHMGCISGDTECEDDERPVRTVHLDGFWLGRHEVTQGQWKKLMGNNPSNFKKGDNYPVESVSWDDVQEFIRKLNAQSSATFHLPSEAQWEYACRAGGKPVTYGTGNGRVSPGNAKYSNKEGSTTPVGIY